MANKVDGKVNPKNESATARIARQALSGLTDVWASTVLPTGNNDAARKRTKEIGFVLPIVGGAASDLYGLSKMVADVTVGQQEWDKHFPQIAELERRVGKSREALQLIDEPKTPLEMAARLSLPTVVGIQRGGKLAAEEAARRTAESAARTSRQALLRTLPPAQRAAAVVATGAKKVTNATARGAVELALPFNTGGARTVIPAITLGTGIREAMDVISPQADYSGIADFVNPERNQEMEDLTAKPFEEFLVPELKDRFDEAIASGDLETAGQLSLAAEEERKRQIEEVVNGPEPDTQKSEWLWGLTAVGALLAGSYAMRSMARAHSQRYTPSNLFGTTTEGQNFNTQQKLIQGFVEDTFTARVAVGDVVGKVKPNGKRTFFGKTEDQRAFESLMDHASPGSIQSKFLGFAKDGILRDSNVRTKPISVLYDEFNTLDGQQRENLNAMLAADSALDDIRNGAAVVFKYQDGRVATQQELEDIVRRGQQDPRLVAMAAEFRGQYRSILDFYKEQGMISNQVYTDLITKRPNYVHLGSSAPEVNALDEAVNSLAGKRPDGISPASRHSLFASREGKAEFTLGTLEFPTNSLEHEWYKALRLREVNEARKGVIDVLRLDPKYRSLIKRVNVDEVSLDDPTIHSYWKAGKQVFFKVEDEFLAQALDFAPFVVRSQVLNTIGMAKRVYQTATTGGANPLFAFKSAGYDWTSAMANRGNNIDIGLISAAIRNSTSLKENKLAGALSTFDPTAVATPAIGAIKYLADSALEGIAHRVAINVDNINPALPRFLGFVDAQDMSRALNSYYSRTTKATARRYGVLGANIYSSRDVQAADLEQIGDSVKSITTTTGSTLPGRLYSTILSAVHESTRMGVASNNQLAKLAITDPDKAALLASQLRRLSADLQARGGAEVNTILNENVAYYNTTIQSLAQTARMFKEQPVTSALNYSSLLGMYATAFMMYAGASAENRQRIRDMSDDQLISGVPFFANTEIPITAEHRLAVAPMIMFLRDYTGINSVNEDGSDNYDPSLSEAWQLMLNDPDKSWATDHLAKVGTQLNPAPFIGSGHTPLPAAGLGLMGVDLPATQRFNAITGGAEGQKVRSNEDPLFGGGIKQGSFAPANVGYALAQLSGLMGTAALEAADDFYRAATNDQSPERAAEIAGSRIVDAVVRQGSPVPSMFPDHQQRLSVNTPEFATYREQLNGVTKAVDVFNDNIMTPNSYRKTDSITSHPFGVGKSVLDPQLIRNNLQLRGTALIHIGAVAAEMQSALRPQIQIMSDLDRQVKELDNRTDMTVGDVNDQVNEVNRQRKRMASQMLATMNTLRDRVREITGIEDFTWADFGDNPKKYAIPPPSGIIDPLPPILTNEQLDIPPQP